MPRKPKLKKEEIIVVVSGVPVTVTLHPPSGARKSWYAYWNGLTASKSTGHAGYDEAVQAVEDMLRNNGRRSTLTDTFLSDEEFEEIQRRHYGKKQDPEARKRSQKSLRECLDAISAFREITGLRRVTRATVDDCERFQQEALSRPKNWRIRYSENRRSERRRERMGAEAEYLSPNTVIKWLVALQAAFERANRNAGKKCVWGVVPESRLLTENPWKNFTWVEGVERDLRQFDHSELLSLLDFFNSNWPGVTFAPVFVKVSLWSWARRLEISSIRWSDERIVGNECHFESTGKWGVTKWFRVPERLYRDLRALQTDSPFVFGGYCEQLRSFHLKNGNAAAARQVRLEFSPENLGDWMYRQVAEWSKVLPKGSAYLHVFRKTSLQYALSGEHTEESVARDARVTHEMMMSSYARETDMERRQKSNRTYRRIRSSLPVDVATRYGYEEKPADRLLERLDLARSQGDWEEVARLAKELSDLERQAG